METELMQRLESLEQQLSQNSRRSFFDKYGARFGGDEGIGTAILAQLNRRGIDTSAADEAVQEIVDNLRKEAAALLDKLNAVSEAVSDATGKTPEDSPSQGTGAVGEGGGGAEEPAPAPEADAGAAPDAGAASPPPDAGAAPPPDAGAAPPAPDAGMGAASPAPDAGAAPPPDPNAVPSDLKVKEVEKKDPDEASKDGAPEEGLEGAEGESGEDILDDFDDEYEEEDDDQAILEQMLGKIHDDSDAAFDLDEDEADFITKILTGGH